MIKLTRSQRKAIKTAIKAIEHQAQRFHFEANLYQAGLRSYRTRCSWEQREKLWQARDELKRMLSDAGH